MCPALFGSRVIFLPVLGPWVATRFRATGLAVLLRRALEKFFGHVLCVVFFWPLRPERVLVASAACAQAAFSIALVCANFLGGVARFVGAFPFPGLIINRLYSSPLWPRIVMRLTDKLTRNP